MIILDRLSREKEFQFNVKDLEETAILHLGTLDTAQRNIFVMFPDINQSMESLANNEEIMRLWTDDIIWGQLTTTHARPVDSAEAALEDVLQNWDKWIDMAYVEKETLHIRGEFRFHAREQEQLGKKQDKQVKGEHIGKEQLVNKRSASCDTTATLLSSVLYFILADPGVYENLKSEIRASFTTESDIMMVSTLNLKYLDAVINETKRIRPPISVTLPRRTRAGGSVICGRHVPEWTLVGVQGWSVSHNEDNFTDCNKFVPERWCEPCPERYVDDKRDIIKTFGVGPRSCLGKNLASAETRVVLARLFWNFDLELCPESKNWTAGMKIYGVWILPKLWVKIRSREGET
ncbi:cytochrome P450 [Rhizodiscina lignyota]|uniref:Cytochrome P450 n=1 Tax=Rhizodiscina lignyota TaxID=1504668 RepID=A0A9P4IHV4_9PEZI|nr:cytochrome P450 [Rhizodiscina lignyota]